MKRFLLSLVGFCSILSLNAESIDIDGLLYDILSESDLTVQLVGNKLSTDTLVDLVIPAKVTIDGKGYEVRKVEYPALKDCNLIKSVTIPSCLQEIGVYAFAGCVNLRKVTFADCDSLVLDYGCFSGSGVNTIILSGNVRYNNEGDYPYWSLDALQLVIAGDIPKFNELSAQTIIINDNVSDLGGVRSLFPEHLYCLGNTPPTLGHLEAFSPETFKRTYVHVPPEAYAAYFQAPEWSSYYHLSNDAVATTELSCPTHDQKLTVGEKYVLSVNKDGTLPVIFFNTVNDNSPCASVVKKTDKDWEITGDHPGEMTIAFACGNLVDTCHITVVESTPTVTLDKSEVRMRTNRTTTVTYTVENVMSQEVEFCVDKPEVILARMIGNKIEVLSVAPGVATLTVKTKEGDCVPGICKFVIYNPDVNGDTSVDVSDVNSIINMMLGKAALNPEADMTGNGGVDIEDVNVVINAMLGK